MKKKFLLLCASIMLFASGCSMNSILSLLKTNTTHKSQAPKTIGEFIPKNSYQNSFKWEGYYFGKFPCPNCLGVETWLHLKKVDNRGEYVFREKFLGLKNRYSDGGISWNRQGNTAKLMSNNGMEVALEKGFAYLLDKVNKRKFLVRKVPVYENEQGAFILDKSTIQHGLSQGNKTVKFRGITNINQTSQDEYQSLQATYLFNCKEHTYTVSRAAYYSNTFAMGKFIRPKIPNAGIHSLVHTIAEKYCK